MCQGRIPRTRLRGVQHRQLTLALDDERALAQFFTARPEILAHEVLTYVRQGEGQDPYPVFTHGLVMVTYGLWAWDHAVGTRPEVLALQAVGLKLSLAWEIFPAAQVRLPSLQTPQELALLLAAQEHPGLALTPAVVRLAGADVP